MLKIRLSHFYNPNINDYLEQFKMELPEISFTISSDQSDGARCNSWWKSELGLRQFFNIREVTKVSKWILELRIQVVGLETQSHISRKI